MQKGRGTRERASARGDTAGCEGNGRGTSRSKGWSSLLPLPLALAGANSNNRPRLGERHRTVVTRANPKYCYPASVRAFTSFGITGFLAVRRGVSLFMENRRKVARASLTEICGDPCGGFKYRIVSSPRAHFAFHEKEKQFSTYFSQANI